MHEGYIKYKYIKYVFIIHITYNVHSQVSNFHESKDSTCPPRGLVYFIKIQLWNIASTFRVETIQLARRLDYNV